MRFGANYTPRVDWFHHWLDFDADSVASDFDAIAVLGVDHIRVFPLWPVVQPNRTLIRAAPLRDLERMLQLAAERGLDVAVDGLQGHLSGFDFVPNWLTSWQRRDLFRDAEAIAGTAAYLRAVAGACQGHPNLLALTVGNEVDQFTGPVHPEPYPASTTDVDAWLDAMISALRAGAPGTPVLHAADDAAWYAPGQPFTPAQSATRGDMTVVHSWVFNGTAQKYGPDAFETTAHARYLVELARAFHTDPDRPVWLQEVGAPQNVLPPENVESFVRDTVAELADTPDLFGITWWCSHDVSRSLADFPAVEYDLGLIDEDGRVKPVARTLREAIDAAREVRAAGLSADEERPRLELHLDGLDDRKTLAPGGAFWERYMHTAREGHPRIVRV